MSKVFYSFVAYDDFFGFRPVGDGHCKFSVFKAHRNAESIFEVGLPGLAFAHKGQTGRFMEDVRYVGDNVSGIDVRNAGTDDDVMPLLNVRSHSHRLGQKKHTAENRENGVVIAVAPQFQSFLVLVHKVF